MLFFPNLLEACILKNIAIGAIMSILSTCTFNLACKAPIQVYKKYENKKVVWWNKPIDKKNCRRQQSLVKISEIN